MANAALIEDQISPIARSLLPARQVASYRFADPDMLRAMSKDTERTTLSLEQAAVRTQRAELRANELQLQVDSLKLQVKELSDRRQTEIQLERFRLWRHGIDIIRWIGVILASWAPLTAVEPLAKAFAGQKTQPHAGLKIALSYSAIVTSALAVTAIQSKLRRQKVKTQRTRLGELERELDNRPTPSQMGGT